MSSAGSAGAPGVVTVDDERRPSFHTRAYRMQLTRWMVLSEAGAGEKKKKKKEKYKGVLCTRVTSHVRSAYELSECMHGVGANLVISFEGFPVVQIHHLVPHRRCEARGRRGRRRFHVATSHVFLVFFFFSSPLFGGGHEGDIFVEREFETTTLTAHGETSAQGFFSRRAMQATAARALLRLRLRE